jgi:hypothetical protein
VGSDLRPSVSLSRIEGRPRSAGAKLVRCYSRNTCAMAFEAARSNEAFACGCVRMFVPAGDTISKQARSKSTPSHRLRSNRSRLVSPANAASRVSAICSKSRGMGEAKTSTSSTSTTFLAEGGHTCVSVRPNQPSRTRSPDRRVPDRRVRSPSRVRPLLLVGRIATLHGVSKRPNTSSEWKHPRSIQWSFDVFC